MLTIFFQKIIFSINLLKILNVNKKYILNNNAINQ